MENKYVETEIVEFWIEDKAIDRIRDGVKKVYKLNVHDDFVGEKVFETNENGKYLTNSSCLGLNKKWKVTDINSGIFPFVLKQYKSIKIRTRHNGYAHLVVLKTDVKPNSTSKYWEVTYKLGGIIQASFFSY